MSGTKAGGHWAVRMVYKRLLARRIRTRARHLAYMCISFLSLFLSVSDTPMQSRRRGGHRRAQTPDMCYRPVCSVSGPQRQPNPTKQVFSLTGIVLPRASYAATGNMTTTVMTYCNIAGRWVELANCTRACQKILKIFFYFFIYPGRVPR